MCEFFFFGPPQVGVLWGSPEVGKYLFEILQMVQHLLQHPAIVREKQLWTTCDQKSTWLCPDETVINKGHRPAGQCDLKVQAVPAEDHF